MTEHKYNYLDKVPCNMCDRIIWNTNTDNGLCFWCNRKILHMAGNISLCSGKPYTRDDIGRPI